MEDVPAAQFEHEEDPELENVPIWHDKQTDAPAEEYNPALQFWQKDIELDPEFGFAVPAEQLKHTVLI